MNWLKLGPNLSFTDENKASNLHWGKYVFYREKWNFEPVMNWKGSDKNVEYLMYYPSMCQKKTLQLQVYIQNNDFMSNIKLN